MDLKTLKIVSLWIRIISAAAAIMMVYLFASAPEGKGKYIAMVTIFVMGGLDRYIQKQQSKQIEAEQQTPANASPDSSPDHNAVNSPKRE